MRRLAAISRAFSPASPVQTRDLFAGRTRQIFRIDDVIAQAGQHAIIFGERGVGKTSLAKFGGQQATQTMQMWATCHSNDNFATIWDQMLLDVQLRYEVKAPGFTGDSRVEPMPVRQLMLLQNDENPSPSHVKRALRRLTASGGSVLVTIDEFDRVRDESTPLLMADLIKILADDQTPVTVVLVGVGRNVDDLMKGHASVVRSLVQIEMPRMAESELREIVERGMKKCAFTVDSRFVAAAAKLCMGLPNYAHLIAQAAARNAAEDLSDHIGLEQLQKALVRALDDFQQTVVEAYTRATASNRDTLYRPVLLACALARKDVLGRFTTSDVRSALDSIGVHKGISSFSKHLGDFSTPGGARGNVLTQLTDPGKWRKYRFMDPLMPPYILIQAYADGDIGLEELTAATS